MTTAARYIVVTPYFKEERRLLERCIGSVRNQTVRVEHLLVSDGFPQEWIDTAGVRHLRLDRCHGDYGNTPRGIGALLACAEGYDGIVLLDADNWLDPRHFELCLATALHAPQCDYVIARRNLMRPDETPFKIPDEPAENHVDTNCFFFLPGSFHMVHFWALMPREVSSLGDRLFYSALRARGLSCTVVDVPTVNYHAMWEVYFRAVGETPPAGAKPVIEAQPVIDWLASLSDRQLAVASRRVGVRLDRLARTKR